MAKGKALLKRKGGRVCKKTGYGCSWRFLLRKGPVSTIEKRRSVELLELMERFGLFLVERFHSGRIGSLSVLSVQGGAGRKKRFPPWRGEQLIPIFRRCSGGSMVPGVLLGVGRAHRVPLWTPAVQGDKPLVPVEAGG